MNINDVGSRSCQQRHMIKLERLGRRRRDAEGWREIVVEDKTAGPAEIAATRIDFDEWLGRLSTRKREIAETLALGETTGKTARRFAMSPGRVSQLRRELMDSWQTFVGELPVAEPAAAAAAAAAA